MARSQVGETAQRIRRQLASSFRYEVARHSGTLAADAAATTVSFAESLAPSVQPGAVLSHQGEDMRVVSVDRVARTATVLRAWQDSTLTAIADGAELMINARFTLNAIVEAMRDEVNSWGPDLYKAHGAAVVTTAGADTVELPAAFAEALHVIEVRRQASAVTIGNETSTSWPVIPVRVQRAPLGAWTAAPTSGVLLRFVEPNPNTSIFVLAALPITLDDAAWTDDLIDDHGLERGMIEVLDLGVKWRLLVDAESDVSSRSSQDDPRRNAETPPGQAVTLSTAVRRLYTRRRAEEAGKLRGKYPVRMSP